MRRAEARAFLAALGCAAVLAHAPRARAWCQMTSSQVRPAPGECIFADPPSTWPLSWHHRCSETTLSTHGSPDMTPDEVRAVLRTSIATWQDVDCMGNGPTGLHVDVLDAPSACTRATYNTHGRNVSSVIFVTDGWVEERMHDPRAYAVTLVWHDIHSGEIWDADMEINEMRGPYGVCPDAGCPDGLVDLQNVTTHEMGHYFGLAHTPDDPLATMWASAEPNETIKRTLEADDIEGICSIYPPGSLPDACDPTPRGGLGLDCTSGNSGCGCSAPGTSVGDRRAAGAIGIVALGLIAVAARRRRRR